MDTMQPGSVSEQSTLSGKVHKVGRYISTYRNWLMCLRLRQAVGDPTEQIQTVYFRDGLQMDVRVGTPDISILYEVLTAGAYASTETLIHKAGGPCAVIDLGANIGAFTLRCARISTAHVYSYEPGPQNAQVLRRNLALNPALMERVTYYQEAVAGQTGTAYWHFDAKNPGGSALCTAQDGIAVQTRSFQEIIARCEQPIALVKIDIEGSEYELLDSTEKRDWQSIPAVLTELHGDPAGRGTSDSWLKRMYDYGFTNQSQEYSSILLRR